MSQEGTDERTALEQNGQGHQDDEVDVIDQPRFSKDSWLSGEGDLREGEVDVPGVGDAVVIRSLSAGQQADIRDACMIMKGDSVKVDSKQMAVMTFLRGVVEPKFELQEVEKIARKFGKAFDLVVSQINEISRATEDEVAQARRRFRPRR